MKKGKFKEFISAIEEQDRLCSALYKLNVDLISYDEGFHSAISLLGRELFTTDGWDVIQSWLYERPEDNSPWYWEAGGEEIPMASVDDLYKYLKKNGWATR